MNNEAKSQQVNETKSQKGGETTSQRGNGTKGQQVKKVKEMERSFENLYVWNEARSLVMSIYGMMDKCRDYGFRDQIQRASVSIMNNIAEGFESSSDPKFINFLSISRGGCGEVRSMLYLCEDLGYCTKEERERLQTQLRKITSGIVNLSDSLTSTSKS